jgi:hypothetical protein
MPSKSGPKTQFTIQMYSLKYRLLPLLQSNHVHESPSEVLATKRCVQLLDPEFDS